MNESVAREIEILWADFDLHDVDQKLESFERLKQITTKEDLPQLISALKSEKSDFWIRELLSEPISNLGGTKYLSELFEALQRNYNDGHDNNSFLHNLTEIAYSEPNLCKKELLFLIKSEDFKYAEYAKWLLTFCEHK